LFPSTSKYARRGVGNFTGNAPVSPRPTCFAPGTAEKMAVLEERAKNKQALWHPFDAQYEGDPRPMRFLAGQGSASDSRVGWTEVQSARTHAAGESPERSR